MAGRKEMDLPVDLVSVWDSAAVQETSAECERVSRYQRF